jgi:YcxB-like protein
MMVCRMETVNLSFHYTQADYVQAMRAHYASRLRLPLDIAVIILVGALGIYEWQSGAHSLGAVFLGISGAFTLMLLAAFFIIPVFAFRREPKFRDEYALSFSPRSIHFRTVHIDSDLQWTMYTRALIASESFILYYGDHQFTVVPKRVFHDDAQRHAFERMLAEKVSNIIDKTDNSAGQE